MSGNEKSNFEKDIIKKYRKELWAPFIKAIKKYNLINEGDKIAVAMSGGKDSLLLAKLFQELHLYSPIKFDLEFISMDPGFNAENLKLHFSNAEELNVPLNIEKSNIFQVIEKIAQDYPCYMCARMRRGYLYKMAQDRGCNKLALGHHFDDVIETTMMNILYAGTFKTMLPKLKSANFKGLELIRPMYLIKEKDIIRIMETNGLDTMNCGCELQSCRVSGKRNEVKKLIKTLKLSSDDIDKNIFRAAENVDLNNIVRWIKNNKEYSYYDDYE